jgi:putative peptide zinc metalloprotease protein
VLLPQYPLPAIYFSLLLLNFSLLWNLNPFLRLDGYWLASDLLGIANLRRAAANTLKQLPSYFKHGTMQVVANTRLQPKTLIYLAVYAVFSNLFFLWLFYLITTQVVFDILQQLPESFGQVMKLQEQDFVFSDWLVTLTRLFWQLVFLYFIVYFIQKSTRRLVTGLWSLIQMRKNKRAATTNSASS